MGLAIPLGKIMNATTTQSALYFQLLYALHDQPLGRRTLVEKTGITEMTVRTHLNKLRDAGLVSMAKSGTELTDKALNGFGEILGAIDKVAEVSIEPLSLSTANVAAHIQGHAEAADRTLHFRDAAVRAGATGAILLIWDGEGWSFSEDADALRENNPRERDLLSAQFEGRSGDVLVIAFGSTMPIAQAGLWNVIAEMMPIDLEKTIQKESE